MDELKAKEAAAAAASEEERADDVPREITLSTGVKFALHPVSQAIIRRAASKVKRPEVPKVYIADKDREEENPDDPDYRQALENWLGDQALAVQKIVYLLGTEWRGDLPEGVEPPEGTNWPKVMLELGLVSEEELADPYLRYIAWLELYAARTEQDQLVLMRLPIQLAGISDREVMDAVTSFRRPARRGADNGSAVEAGGADGDNLPRAARRARARDRRKGSR